MKLDLKSKLLFLSIVPILFILILSFMILSQNFSEKRDLEFTKHNILEAMAISRVVHFMQIERGTIAGLIASKNLNSEDKALVSARESLDKAIEDTKNVLSLYTHKNNNDSIKLLDEIKSRKN